MNMLEYNSLCTTNPIAMNKKGHGCRSLLYFGGRAINMKIKITTYVIKYNIICLTSLSD